VKNVSLAPTGWNTVVLPPGNVFTGPPDVVDSVSFLVAWIANAPITVAIIQGDTTTVIGTGASGRVTTPSAITLGPAQFQITAGSTPIESIQVSVLGAQLEGYLPLSGGTMLGPIVGTLTGTASNTKELQGVGVSETAPATSDVLEYNGTEWVPSVLSSTGLQVPTTGPPGDIPSPTTVGETYLAYNSGGALTATVTVGTSPEGVAITPDGSYAYVANEGSETVSVIEISTNTVTATVAVGTDPTAVAITPDGSYAYVANQGSGTVSVIEISTNTVTATVTVENNPYGVAITPDGSYAYVANDGSGTVSVIEISTNTVTATVTVGTDPTAVAITPDGSYAYVANEGSGTVSVIEISTNTVTATVTVENNPYGVAITPDGSYAYVANDGSGTVSVIEISTNTVTATVTVGTDPWGVAITPDGSYAYVANYVSGTVSVIEISTNTVTATVTVGNSPRGVAITPHGGYAYVTNEGSNTVSVLSLPLSTLFAVLSAGSWTPIASELPVPGASGDVLTATGTAAGDYDWAAPAAPTLAYGGGGIGGGSWAANNASVIVTTPTLQPGTYLVTAGMITYPQAAPSSPAQVTLELQADSATASFVGQNEALGLFGQYAGTSEITVTVACIVTVTAAGTLELVINPAVAAATNGGGYTYVQIA